MPGLGKEVKSQSYFKYSMYTHISVLGIKFFQFFTKLMYYETHHK